jgi:NAD+ diphosphatase
MIQDIQPYAFDNTFRHKTPDARSQILHIRDNAVLIRETEDGIAFPAYGELAPPDTEYTYLFSIDDTIFFLALPADPQEDYAYAALMEFRGKKPRHLAYAAAVGCQLYDWYSKNRFCGRCSAPMAHDGKERMMRCPRCDNMVFPRISPAVIVGIIDGDRILLTRYSGRLYRRYALVAGFAETGEAIEETVQREVMEEVGLRVKNLRYYKSQP